MNLSLKQSRWAALALIGLITSAQAHPGHGGLLSGFTHPWAGADHLAAMVAVGLWATTLQGRQRFVLPLAFITTTLLGALLPASPLLLSFAEQGIVLSLLVLGGGLLMMTKMPLQTASVLMALAGLCHGYAHGAEIPAADGAASFIVGMLIATAILHALGLFAGRLTTLWKPQLARFWGAPVALVGIAGLIS